MRPPRVRFTLRRMMLAILLIAAVVGGCLEVGWYRERVRRRRYDYLRAASAHMIKAAGYRRKAEDAEMMARSAREMAGLTPATSAEFGRMERDNRDLAVRWSRRAADEDALDQKYRLGLKRPWLPVAPDPPDPE